MRSMRIN